jgi:spore maturation protein SpmB
MDTTKCLPAGMAPIDMTAWLTTLAQLAVGLDLTTGDGRTMYRLKVQGATDYQNVGVLRNIAHQLGVSPVPNARRAVQRKIADQVIAVARGMV